MRTKITIGLLVLAATCTLGSGCCKSLMCAARHTAGKALTCRPHLLELEAIDPQVARSPRGAVRGRRYLEAAGCGETTYLECDPRDSGVMVDDPSRADASGSIPPEFADPHWRCWTIEDPLAIPEVPPIKDPADPTP